MTEIWLLRRLIQIQTIVLCFCGSMISMFVFELMGTDDFSYLIIIIVDLCYNLKNELFIIMKSGVGFIFYLKYSLPRRDSCFVLFGIRAYVFHSIYYTSLVTIID